MQTLRIPNILLTGQNVAEEGTSTEPGDLDSGSGAQCMRRADNVTVGSPPCLRVRSLGSLYSVKKHMI